MAVIKMKPTSPGRRGVVKISRDHLHKGAPHAALLEPQFQHAGRNNNGHITTRHKGGGHKHHYRLVDFRRIKDGIPAKVERIEYDPNRSAHIALVCYADGERTYIIAPRGLEVGASIMSGSEAPIRVGNTLPIRNIPVGSIIHCVELQVGKGAQMIDVYILDLDRQISLDPLSQGEDGLSDPLWCRTAVGDVKLDAKITVRTARIVTCRQDERAASAIFAYDARGCRCREDAAATNQDLGYAIGSSLSENRLNRRTIIKSPITPEYKSCAL